MSININSTQISALLQLYPMAIPGAEENLQPPGAYHLGIPESIHSPSTKLFMVIDPVTLFSTPFAAGDSVRLWVNGQATSVIKPIKPGEENDRIFMELLWGVMKDGLNTLYYEVTRVSGNKDKSDPILNVLLNNPVSGITVTHPASIGPGQPATFTLTRDYPREYDVMTLTVGRWSKTIPYVHPANPITYTLTTSDLQQIGDGTHPVNATEVDQLSNRNLSATTSIDISANQQLIDPTLTNVLDANNNEVQEGTSTFSNALTLKGMASPGLQIECFDGSVPSAVPLGTATADTTSGIWELRISVQPGSHRFYAESRYHSGPVYSNVRTLIVRAPLSIYTPDMILAGFSLKVPSWTKTGQDSVGNTEIRTAQGGQPNYVYTSMDTSIASVDQNGKVTGNRNGTTTIVVTDSMNSSVQFNVLISNIWQLVINEQLMSAANAYSWLISIGGTGATNTQYRNDVSRVYQTQPLNGKIYWTGEPPINQGRRANFFIQDWSQIHLSEPIIDWRWGAACLKPL